MKSIQSNIKKAKKYLDNNHCIAVPTETVYGLAANAYSTIAVKKIFRLKKRPKLNPLIVHYSDYKKAERDVVLNKKFFKLYKKFCPGPITFILKKKKNSKIHKLVNGNLKTVAVRFPNHKVAKILLKKIQFPLAMPSANVSGGISPICAKDVAEEFKKNIKFIIDGKRSKIGIESTVIDLIKKPKILRKGIIDANKIKKILKVEYIKKNRIIKSPGLLGKHYSPGIPIKLNQKKCKIGAAFITFGNKYEDSKNYFNLSKNGDLKEAASNLYKIFRKIKKKGFKQICVVKIPNKEAGIAINDRLMRASK